MSGGKGSTAQGQDSRVHHDVGKKREEEDQLDEL
jgi:hypothetical protein